MKRMMMKDACKQWFIDKYGAKALSSVMKHERVAFTLIDNPNPSDSVFMEGITFGPTGMRKEWFEIPEYNYFYQFVMSFTADDTVGTMIQKLSQGLVVIKPRAGVINVENRTDWWTKVYRFVSSNCSEPVILVGTFKSSKPYVVAITSTMWTKIFGDSMFKYDNPCKAADYSRSATREFQVPVVYGDIKGVDFTRDKLKVLYVDVEACKTILPYGDVVSNDGELFINARLYKPKHNIPLEELSDISNWDGDIGPRQIRMVDADQVLNVKGKLTASLSSWLIGLDIAKQCVPDLDFNNLPDVIFTGDTQKSKAKRVNGEIFYINKQDIRFVNKAGRKGSGRVGVQSLAGMTGLGTTAKKMQSLFRAEGMMERASILNQALKGNVESIYEAIVAGKETTNKYGAIDENLVIATKLLFSVPKIVVRNGEPIVLYHRVIPTPSIMEGMVTSLNKYFVNKVMKCPMGKIRYVNADPRLDIIEAKYNAFAKANGLPFKRFIIPDTSFVGNKYLNVVRSPITSIMNMAGLTPITYEDYVFGEYTGSGSELYCEYGSVYMSNSTQRMMQGDFDGDTSLVINVTDDLHFDVYPHYVFPDKGIKPELPTEAGYTDYFRGVLTTIIESAGNVGKVDVRRRKVYIDRCIKGKLLTALTSYGAGEFCETGTIKAMKWIGRVQIDDIDKLFTSVYSDGKESCPFTGLRYDGIKLDMKEKMLAKDIAALHNRKVGISANDDPNPSDVKMFNTYVDKCKVVMTMTDKMPDVKARLSSMLPHWELFEYSTRFAVDIEAKQSEYVQLAFSRVYDKLLSVNSTGNRVKIGQFMRSEVYELNRFYSSENSRLLTLERNSEERKAGYEALFAKIKSLRDAMILKASKPVDKAMLIAAYLGKICFGKVRDDVYRSGGMFWLFCNPIIPTTDITQLDSSIINVLGRNVVVKLAKLYQEELEVVMQERSMEIWKKPIGKYNVNPLTVVASEYLDNALKSDLEYRAGSEIDLDADDVEE